jgi:uncharacterized membrane protein YjgN (DUF898 family)
VLRRHWDSVPPSSSVAGCASYNRDTSMILTRIGWGLAVLAIVAVLCVAVIFFFPAIQGPYSAVNGPVTALQSAQAASRVRVAIVLAAFSLIANFLSPSLAWVSSRTIVCVEPQTPSRGKSGTILRC